MSRLAAAVALAWLAACTPSLRLVHRGDVYFERCYSADVDPSVEEGARRACWSAWEEHYTLGQSADRVAFARGRAAGRIAPAPSLLVAAPAVAASVQGLDAEVHSADPASEPSTHVPEHGPRVRSAPPRAIRGPCSDRICQPAWQQCAARCAADGSACLTACELDYRTCARACY